MAKAKKPHYVDNKHFQLLLEERAAQIANGESPRISEELGGIFLKIANGMKARYNFSGDAKLSNYTRDEFVSESSLIMCRKIDKYDPSEYKNPFAYFSQLAFYESIGVIRKENRARKAEHIIYDALAPTITNDEFGDNVNDPYYNEDELA